MGNKKSYDYFDSFIKYADCALRAAKKLNSTLTEFDYEAAPERLTELHLIEHEADEIGHQTMEHLLKEFLPPIEREDIAEITHELDNVVDLIDDIMRCVCMYDVMAIKPEIPAFCELMIRCSTTLKELMCEMKNFKKSATIKDIIVKINSLESEGDTLHFNAIKSLFCERNNTLEAIVWKNIYDDFEACYDSFEHVSDGVESIVLKNS